MSELKERIEKLKAKLTAHPYTALNNDPIPLLTACQSEIERLERELKDSAVAMNEENDRHIERIKELERELEATNKILGQYQATTSQKGSK